MDFKVKIGNNEVNWNDSETEQKLKQLGAADKKAVWVHRDISCTKSSWISRVFWDLVGKHFAWTRRTFYNVDLEQSKSILQQLQPQITDSKQRNLAKLFNEATANFNNAFPKHQVSLSIKAGSEKLENKDSTPESVKRTPKREPSTENPVSEREIPLLDPRTKTVSPDKEIPLIDVGSKEGTFGETFDKEIPLLTKSMEKAAITEEEIGHLAELAQNYDDNAEEILTSASELLVKLASLATFEKHFPTPFPSLKQMVDSKEYDYLPKILANSQKLRVILPLLLIKGLNSKTPEVKEIAKETLENLVKQYLVEVKHAPHHKSFKDTLLALSKAYYDTIEDKEAREEALLKLWEPAGERKKTILFELTKHPWNIKPEYKKLKRAMSLKGRKHFSSTLTKTWTMTQSLKGVKSTNLAQTLLDTAIQDEMPSVASYLSRQVSQEELRSSLKKAKQSNKTSVQEIAGWLEKVNEKPKVSPSNLKHYAEELGYGYKSANLMVLNALCSSINNDVDSLQAQVPPFLPISDLEVKSEVKDLYTIVEKHWNAFLSSFDAEQKEQFLKAANSKEAAKVPLKISEKGEQVLTQIKEEFRLFFEKNTFYSIQIEEWLEENKPEFVIVRSTGKEDSDENSNAGGNESIPYVKPDGKAISYAVGEVLASYFGRKSVTQRLIAGDRSLFTDSPFMPVLIQTMVGENIGGVGSKEEDVPRCGVMFTQQSKINPDVTLVQTGLGNNEGVVSSQVSVDTYLLDDTMGPQKVVRNKKTRFVSHQVGFDPDEYELVQIKNNNSALEKGQAIPDELLWEMKKVANAISTTYGGNGTAKKAMDVEYTIKLKEKGHEKPVLYLLQARPLLAVAESTPSYLQMAKLTDAEKIEGVTLLDGGSAVRKIESPEEVIVVNDLPQALHAYVNNKNPQNIKAIIIRKMAPSTSHEAVMLRPKGVPVFVLENLKDFNQAAQWVKKSKNQNILVDPQRGLVVKGNSEEDEKAIAEGWISYPIPLELSMVNVHERRNAPLDENTLRMKFEQCQELTKSLGNSILGRGGLEEKPLSDVEGHLKKLISEISTANAREIKEPLGQLLGTMWSAAKENYDKNSRYALDPKDSKFALASNTYNVLSVYETILKYTQTCILPALENTEPQSPKRLYAIKFLEAMLMQKPQNHVVGSSSLISLLEKDKELSSLLRSYNKKFTIKLDGAQVLKVLDLMQMEKLAFSKKTEEVWKEFVKTVNNFEAVANQFQKTANTTATSSPVEQIWSMAMRMKKLDLLPIWMNLVFMGHWENLSTTEDNLLDISVIKELKSVHQKDSAALDWVEENLEELAVLEQQISNWENPAFPAKNIAKLKKKFVEKFGFSDPKKEGSLAQRYEESGQLGRLAILQFMGKAVDLYDRVIKTQKGSAQYTSEKQKTEDFAKLLEGYFTLLDTSIKLISPKDEEELMTPAKGNMLSFDQYLKKLKSGTKYTIGGEKTYNSPGFDTLKSSLMEGKVENPEKLMLGSSHFSVDGFVIGNKADMLYSVHWPMTLEDYFTAIHQNLEKVRKHQMTKCGFGTEVLDGQVKTYAELIEEKFQEPLSHLEILDSGVEAVFQIPLRFHSSRVSIFSDPDKPEEIKLEAEVLGHNAFERWDIAAALIGYLAQAKGIRFPEGEMPKIDYSNTDGIKFSLHVTSDCSSPETLVKELAFIIKELSMGPFIFENKTGAEAFFLKLESIRESLHDLPSFNELGEDFFKSAPWAAVPLMKKYHQENNSNAIVKAAAGALEGIASYGLEEYLRSGDYKDMGLENYFSKPAYDYVPNNEIWNERGLKLISTLQLIRALENKTEGAAKEIERLINLPIMKEKLPETVEALKTALDKQLPLADQCQKLIMDQDYFNAFAFAVEHGLNIHHEVIVNIVKSKDAKIKLDFVRKYLTTYYWGKNKAAGDSLIKVFFVKDKSHTEMLKTLSSPKSRQKRRTEFEKNVLHLRDYTAKERMLPKKVATQEFTKYTDKILELSVDTLIGLSQTDSWDSHQGEKFECLNGYLGNKKYAYCQPKAMKHQTGKPGTAAPIYIIKIIEQAGNDKKLMKKVISQLDRLFSDYYTYGKYGKHAESYRSALLSIARGYCNSSNEKTAAKKQIELWTKDDPTFLKELNEDPVIVIPNT